MSSWRLAEKQLERREIATWGRVVANANRGHGEDQEWFQNVGLGEGNQSGWSDSSKEARPRQKIARKAGWRQWKPTEKVSLLVETN